MKHNRTIVHEDASSYGRYRVIDETYNGRPARVLYGDDDTPQSGTTFDDDPELLFSYNQRFFEIIMSHQPERLLVIGGGGFMLPTAAYHRFPGMQIDVVEIDEVLVQISRDHFGLPVDERLIVHIGDGARFVADSQNKYDLIIIDAFSGSTIPPHLLQRDTIKSYHDHLTKNGVIALNFISEYQAGKQQLAHEIIASFQEVFSQVSLYQADPDYLPDMHQNHILTASNTEMQFDYLQSAELELH